MLKICNVNSIKSAFNGRKGYYFIFLNLAWRILKYSFLTGMIMWNRQLPQFTCLKISRLLLKKHLHLPRRSHQLSQKLPIKGVRRRALYSEIVVWGYRLTQACIKHAPYLEFVDITFKNASDRCQLAQTLVLEGFCCLSEYVKKLTCMFWAQARF